MFSASLNKSFLTFILHCTRLALTLLRQVRQRLGYENESFFDFHFALRSPCTNFAHNMEEDNYLYSQTVLDFVTVSTEFCKYLEQCEGTDLDNFTQIMRGLLPMLYLKATLINDVPEVAGWNEKKLTESDYEYIRSSVARIMGDKDDF